MNTELLKEAVKNSALNKLQIAERSGISRTTLDNVLAGADVKVSTIEAICETIGIHAASLFENGDVNFNGQSALLSTIRTLQKDLEYFRGRVLELEGKGAAAAS